MLLSKSLFAALAVAVVNVKGAFDRPLGESSDGYLGWVVFCDHYGFEGHCTFYEIPAESQCMKPYGNNNVAMSFKADFGIKCVGFDSVGCSLHPKNLSIDLPLEVDNLTAIGLGRKISSFKCEDDPYLGWVRFCYEYDFGGHCTIYNMPKVDAPCLEIGELNDQSYSFKSAPGVKCFAFDKSDCTSLEKNDSITLESDVDNLSVPGFGGRISSFSCVSDQYLGWVKFCTGYELQGDCVQYKVPISSPCQKIDERYNDAFYSFKSTPGMSCSVFEDYDCPNLATNGQWVTLGTHVGNLNDMGFGGKVSSFRCT